MKIQLGQIWKLKQQHRMNPKFPERGFVGCMDYSVVLLEDLKGTLCPWIARPDLPLHYDLESEPVIVDNLKGFSIDNKFYIISEQELYKYVDPTNI